MTGYFTDGERLYEIVAQRVVQNYGLHRGILRYTILEDCVTGEATNVDDLMLAALTEVQALEEAA